MQCRSGYPVTLQRVEHCLKLSTDHSVSAQALSKQSKHFRVKGLLRNSQAFAEPLTRNCIKKVPELSLGFVVRAGALRQSVSESQLVSQPESASKPTLTPEAQAATLSEDRLQRQAICKLVHKKLGAGTFLGGRRECSQGVRHHIMRDGRKWRGTHTTRCKTPRGAYNWGWQRTW